MILTLLFPLERLRVAGRSPIKQFTSNNHRHVSRGRPALLPCRLHHNCIIHMAAVWEPMLREQAVVRHPGPDTADLNAPPHNSTAQN